MKIEKINLCKECFSKENLKKAFEYIENENQKSSLPTDPIGKPIRDAIDKLGNNFFDTLSKYLNKQEYNSNTSTFLYADKANLGLRPISVLSIVL
jgi:hypothetical protein